MLVAGCISSFRLRGTNVLDGQLRVLKHSATCLNRCVGCSFPLLCCWYRSNASWYGGIKQRKRATNRRIEARSDNQLNHTADDGSFKKNTVWPSGLRQGWELISPIYLLLVRERYGNQEFKSLSSILSSESFRISPTTLSKRNARKRPAGGKIGRKRRGRNKMAIYCLFMEHRKPELEAYKRVGLTRQAYEKLREIKKKKKKSMMQIICELILKEPL